MRVMIKHNTILEPLKESYQTLKENIMKQIPLLQEKKLQNLCGLYLAHPVMVLD